MSNRIAGFNHIECTCVGSREAGLGSMGDRDKG